jgi:hypothetical protein
MIGGNLIALSLDKYPMPQTMLRNQGITVEMGIFPSYCVDHYFISLAGFAWEKKNEFF